MVQPSSNDSSVIVQTNKTLNLRKAYVNSKYSERPNHKSPSPNFMRMTQSYINNINDSREEGIAVLNTSLNNKSMLSSIRASSPVKQVRKHRVAKESTTTGFANFIIKNQSMMHQTQQF